MVPQTRSEALRRLFNTANTQADYSHVPGYFSALASNSGIINLASFRGIDEMIFYGTGADNSTASARLYAIRGISDPSGAVTELYATVDVTLGALTGSVAAGILNTERFADVLTVVNGPYATWLEQVYPGSGVRTMTPSAGLIASIAMPDLGNVEGLLVDVNLGTATGLNVLYRRGT